jgi:hypothetical protein
MKNKKIEPLTDQQRYGSFSCRSESPIEGAKVILPFWEKRWIQGYKYNPKNVLHFPPKPLVLPPNLLGHTVNKNIRYVFHGVLAVMYDMTPDNKQGQFVDVDDLLLEQLNYYDKHQGLCIYASVLLYCLLREESIIDNKKIKYVQGFARTIPSPNYKLPSTGKPTDVMYTLHAFVTYDDAVIDLTAAQLSKYLDDLLDPPFVIGEQGYKYDIFKYYGYKEYPTTAERYAKMFAKEANMTYEQWINHHKKQALKYMQI